MIKFIPTAELAIYKDSDQHVRNFVGNIAYDNDSTKWFWWPAHDSIVSLSEQDTEAILNRLKELNS